MALKDIFDKFFKPNKVNKLLGYIKKCENYDSDYWMVAGYKDIIIELNQFKDNDWRFLNQKLINWSSNQKSILALALTYQDPNCPKINEDIEISKLYSYIFLLVDDEELEYFWEENWDVLLSNDLETLQSIKKRIIEYVRKKPNIYNDGKLMAGYNFEIMFDTLDKQIIKASR